VKPEASLFQCRDRRLAPVNTNLESLRAFSSTLNIAVPLRIMRTHESGNTTSIEYIFLTTNYPEDILSTTERIRPIILKDLSHPQFLLKKTISIIVEREADGYILSNDEVNVHAFGETIHEAEEEWKYILVNLYLSYRDTPNDQLTPGGKTLKEILESYVGER
jgi:hypothetical protein